jgi:hypothetical protein
LVVSKKHHWVTFDAFCFLQMLMYYNGIEASIFAGQPFFFSFVIKTEQKTVFMNVFKLLTLLPIAAGFAMISSCETICVEPVNADNDSTWYNPSDSTATPYDSTYYYDGTTDSTNYGGGDSTVFGGGGTTDSTWYGGGTGGGTDTTGWTPGDSTNFGG